MQANPESNGASEEDLLILPQEGGYVVQLARWDAAGQLRGRMEHLQSGRARRFDSAEELISLMTALMPGAPQGGDRP